METMSTRDAVEIVLPHILCVETLREPSVHHFLKHLFTPKEQGGNGVFKKELYETLIISWLCVSFSQPHVVTRVAILKQIDKYLTFIESEELNSKIWSLFWAGLN